MAIARCESHRVGLHEQRFHEMERLFQGAGLGKDSRMRNDSDDCAQDNVRKPEYLFGDKSRLEPAFVFTVPFRIAPKRIDQNIRIGKDHVLPSMRSSKEAESSKSTPGRSPPDPDVGILIRRFEACACFASSASRNASSITDVNVFWDPAARSFASCSKRSLILMVVLMHQNISHQHLDVKSILVCVPIA